MQAEIDKIIWFCIGTDKSLASDMNWESPCTKVCAMAWVSSPAGLHLGPGVPCSVPQECSGVSVLRFPGQTWPGSGNSPFPRQEPAFCQNLHPVWEKSATRPRVTGHRRLTALAVFPRKMAPEKRFHIFRQLEGSIKHKTATNFLSFFSFMIFVSANGI